MVAVTKQKAVPSMEFSTAKGNLENKKWRTPCWICYNHLQKEWKNEMHLPGLRQLGATLRMKLSKNSLMVRNFLGCHRCGERDTLAEDTKSKKGVIGPHREEITKCHSLSERSQFVRFVRRRKQQKHESSAEENQRRAWMGLYLLQNSETWSRQITNYWMWKTSRDADAKTL